MGLIFFNKFVVFDAVCEICLCCAGLGEDVINVHVAAATHKGPASWATDQRHAGLDKRWALFEQRESVPTGSVPDKCGMMVWSDAVAQRAM